jgi:DNA-binding XRE family transcriptional regulator
MKKKETAGSYPSTRALKPDKLEKLRKQKFGSRAEFADYVGISEKTVQNAENGKPIKEANAAAIASALKRRFDQLFLVREGKRVSDIAIHPRPVFGRALSSKELKIVSGIAQSVGVSESRLVDDVSRGMNEKGRLARLLKFREDEYTIRAERKDTQLLAQYYRDSLAKCGLGRYAINLDGEIINTHIAVSSAMPVFKVDLEEERSLFGLVNSSFATPQPTYKQIVNFMVDSLLLGVRVKNEPVFCLHDIDLKFPKAPISFRMAKYLEYRLGLGSLRNELIRGLVRSKLDVKKAYSKRESLLPCRKQFLKDGGTLLAFHDRLCVGGVNVFFALKRPNDFAFYVEERSEAVASARREACIIPSGFHQPLTSIHAALQISVRESVFRELWEELFNGKKVISHDGHTEADWYYQYPPLAWFERHKKDFQHEWICFGLDLIDGSYQFGIFLIVNDSRYWEKYRRRIATNYEFRHTGAKLVPISTKDRNGISELLRNPYLAHTSVFTLAEGLQRLQALDKERRYVDIPEIKRLIQTN